MPKKNKGGPRKDAVDFIKKDRKPSNLPKYKGNLNRDTSRSTWKGWAQERPTIVQPGKIKPGQKFTQKPPYKPSFPLDKFEGGEQHYSMEEKGLSKGFWTPNRIWTYKKVLDMNPEATNRPDWLTDEVADGVQLAYDVMEWRSIDKASGGRTSIPHWSLPTPDGDKEFYKFLEDLPRPISEEEKRQYYDIAMGNIEPAHLDFLPDKGSSEYKSLTFKQKALVELQRGVVGVAGDPIKLGAAIGLVAGVPGVIGAGGMTQAGVQGIAAAGQGALFGAGMAKYEKFAEAAMVLDYAWQALERPIGMLGTAIDLGTGIDNTEKDLRWFMDNLPAAWAAASLTMEGAEFGIPQLLGAEEGEVLSWDTPWYEGEFYKPEVTGSRDLMLAAMEDIIAVEAGNVPDEIEEFVSEHFQDGMERVEAGEVDKKDVLAYWSREMGVSGFLQELFGAIFLDPLNWALGPHQIVGDMLTGALKAGNNLDARTAVRAIDAVAGPKGSKKWTAVPQMYAELRKVATNSDPNVIARLTESGWKHIEFDKVAREGTIHIDAEGKPAEAPVVPKEGLFLHEESGKYISWDEAYDMAKTAEGITAIADNVKAVGDQEGVMGKVNRLLLGVDKEGRLRILEPTAASAGALDQPIGAALTGGLLGGVGHLIAGVPGMLLAGFYGLKKGWGFGISGLFSLTPRSRAALMTSKMGDYLGITMEHARHSVQPSMGPGLVLNYLTRLATDHTEVAKDLSIAAIGGPEGAVLPHILNDDVLKDVGAKYSAWEETHYVRKLMDQGAKALDMEYGDFVNSLADPSKAKGLYKKLLSLAENGEANSVRALEAMTKHEMDVNKLSETAKKLADGVIYNDSNQFFGEIYSLLLDSTNKWATEWYGVKPKPFEHQFINAVKSVQTLLLLSANINFALKNKLDNHLVLAFDGYGKPRSQAYIDDLWANRVGFTPLRLRAGVGPAGLGGIEFTESMKHLRKAERIEGPLTNFADAAYQVNKRIGFATKLSADAESSASAQVYTNAFLEFYNAVNKPGVGFDDMPVGLKAQIQELHPEMYGDIISHIKGSMNNQEIMAAMNMTMTRKGLDAIVDMVASSTGHDADLVRSGLQQLNIYDDLKAELQKAETDLEIRQVYENTIQDLYQGILDNLEKELIGYEDYVAALVQPDAEGYIGAWSMMNDHAYESMALQMLGYKEYDAIFLRRLEDQDIARAKVDIKQQDDNMRMRYKIHHLREKALMLGVTKGLDQSSRVHVWNLVDQKNAGWDTFFDARTTRMSEFWGNRAGMTKAEASVKWRSMMTDLNDMYTKTVSEESYIMRKVDNRVADLIGKVHGEEVGEIARMGMEETRNIRDQSGQEMRGFREGLDGVTDYAERYTAWNEFQQNIQADSVQKMNTHAGWVDDVNHLINGGDPSDMPSSRMPEPPDKGPMPDQIVPEGDAHLLELAQKLEQGKSPSASELDMLNSPEGQKVREMQQQIKEGRQLEIEQRRGPDPAKESRVSEARVKAVSDPLMAAVTDLEWEGLGEILAMDVSKRIELPLERWHPSIEKEIKGLAKQLSAEALEGKAEEMPIQQAVQSKLIHPDDIVGLSEDAHTELLKYYEGHQKWEPGKGSELGDRTIKISKHSQWYKDLTAQGDYSRQSIISALERLAKGDKQATKPPANWGTQRAMRDIVYSALMGGYRADFAEIPPNLLFSATLIGIEDTLKIVDGIRTENPKMLADAIVQLNEVSPSLAELIAGEVAKMGQAEALEDIQYEFGGPQKRNWLVENQQIALEYAVEDAPWYTTKRDGAVAYTHLLDAVNIYNKEGFKFQRLEDVPPEIARQAFELRQLVKMDEAGAYDDNFSGRVAEAIEADTSMGKARKKIDDPVKPESREVMEDYVKGTVEEPEIQDALMDTFDSIAKKYEREHFGKDFYEDHLEGETHGRDYVEGMFDEKMPDTEPRKPIEYTDLDIEKELTDTVKSHVDSDTAYGALEVIKTGDLSPLKLTEDFLGSSYDQQGMMQLFRAATGLELDTSKNRKLYNEWIDSWQKKLTPDRLEQAEGKTIGAAEPVAAEGLTKYILHSFIGSDVDTVLEEGFHAFRKTTIIGEDNAILAEWAGAKRKGEAWVWDRAAEEKAAQGFKEYMLEGKAPTPALTYVFETIKRYLMKVYSNLRKKPGVVLNDDVRKVFDQMFDGEVNQAETIGMGEIPKKISEFKPKSVGADEQLTLLQKWESEGVKWDDQEGMGAWGDPANALREGYGFVVWMKPDDYRKLNPKSPHVYEGGPDRITPMVEMTQKGQVWGNPMVRADFNEGAWQVTEHEGRHRAMMAEKIAPGKRIPVTVVGGNRMKWEAGLTDEMKIAPIIADQRTVGLFEANVWDEAYTGEPFRLLGGSYDEATSRILFQRDDGIVDSIPKESEPQGAAGAFKPGAVEESLGFKPDYMRAKEQLLIEEYIPTLQEMSRQHTSPEAKYPGKVMGQTLSPEAAKELQRYLWKVNGQQSSTKLLGSSYAENRRDFGLHNYSMEYGIDDLLSMGMPYHLWYTRAMMKWGIRLMSDPAYLARYAKLSEKRKISAPDEFPGRLEGKMRIPMAWMPEWAKPKWMGEAIYIDPKRALFPISQLTRVWDQPIDEDRMFERQVYYALENMVSEETITEQDFVDAVTGKNPAVYEEAMQQAHLRVGENKSHPLEFIEAISGFHIPLDMIKRAREGTLDEMNQLPITRFIKNATSPIKPGGLNIEAPIRKAFGAPADGMLGDFYIIREMGNMVADGNMTLEQMRAGAVAVTQGDRQSPDVQAAMKRVDQYQRLRYLGQILAADVLPKGEEQLRALGAEFYRTLESEDPNDTSKFFDKYPQYEARLMLTKWDDPEAMAKKALESQIWDTYMNADEITKKAARHRFGDQFETSFLDQKDTENISTETLALWSQLLSGEDFEILKGDAKDESPLVDIAAMQAYEQFTQTSEAKGVDLERIQQLQQIYYDTREVDQASFLQHFPELSNYWDWKNQYIASHPELIEYLGSEKVRSMPKEIQKLYLDYEVAKMEHFGPDIYQIQDGYFALPKEQRKGYINQYPELKRYWDWRREVLKQLPELEPYITYKSGEIPTTPTLEEHEGEYGPYMVDISSWSPDLVQNISAYYYSKREIGAGTTAMLRSKWIELGRPGKSFIFFLNEILPKSFMVH